MHDRVHETGHVIHAVDDIGGRMLADRSVRHHPGDGRERVLGHVIGGVRGIYDRHEYHAEKKKALEMLAAQITAIVDPPPSNIHQFKPAAGDK